MASFTADEIDFVRSRGNEVSYLSFSRFFHFYFFLKILPFYCPFYHFVVLSHTLKFLSVICHHLLEIHVGYIFAVNAKVLLIGVLL